MKQYILFSISLLSMTIAASAQAPTNLDVDKAKMSAIIQRARQGDTSALMGAASLDPSVSVPMLGEVALDRTTNAEMADEASRALAQISNVEQYLGNQIQDFSKQNTEDAAFDRSKAFDILAQIHTEKAVATMTGFLFDDITPDYNGGDFTIVRNKYAALFRLWRMHLQGAPSDNRSPLSYSEQVIAWRKWAIARGYVPKDWISRIGASNLKPQENAVKPAPQELPSTPHPTEPAIPASSQSPHELQHAAGLSATPDGSAGEANFALNSNGHKVAWLVAVLLIVTVVGAYISRRRQKP